MACARKSSQTIMLCLLSVQVAQWALADEPSSHFSILHHLGRTDITQMLHMLKQQQLFAEPVRPSATPLLWRGCFVLPARKAVAYR